MPMRYTPLQHDREIRILEIVRIANNARISLRLRHIHLDDAPSFVAISYVWRVDDEKLNISVNGHSFQVSRNLFDILMDRITYLEDNRISKMQNKPLHFYSRYLWVDAICINQSDLRERIAQVLLMSEIYGRSSVSVCLGTGNTELARTAWYCVGNLRKHKESDPKVDISAEDWLALHEMFAKTWFKRSWVIQEFVLPPFTDLMIWNAHRPIHSDHLYKAALQLFALDPVGLTSAQKVAMRDGMREYINLFETKALLQTKVVPRLLTALLWIFRDRQVTDPRDKVYSLLALVQEHGRSRRDESGSAPELLSGLCMRKLVLDYAAEVEDIYASLVDAVLSATHSLNILCAVQNSSTFTRSWVPNWAEPWQKYSFATANIHQSLDQVVEENEDFVIGHGLFRASGNKTAIATFSADGTALKAWGTEWDRVGSLHDTLGFPPPLGETVFHHGVEVFDSLNEKAKSAMCHAYVQQSESEGIQDEELEKETSSKYENRQDKDQTKVIHQLVIAMLGGHFRKDVARGLDPGHFNTLASQEYHELCTSFHLRDVFVDRPSMNHGNFEVRSSQVGYKRKIFIGEGGYCGLVADSAEVGDKICILFGCDVPVLLRQINEEKCILIEECYVQGIMFGEAMEMIEKGAVKAMEFDIV